MNQAVQQAGSDPPECAMLVLRSLMGGRKTIVYVSLVVVMSTITGLLYGWLAG